jgi:hypothetical protein
MGGYVTGYLNSILGGLALRNDFDVRLEFQSENYPVPVKGVVIDDRDPNFIRHLTLLL